MPGSSRGHHPASTSRQGRSARRSAKNTGQSARCRGSPSAAAQFSAVIRP